MLYKEEIQKKASALIKQHPENRVECLGGLSIFEQVLVGYGSADDPLFEKLKEPGVVADYHLTPKDFLPEAQTVISFFLGFSDRVRTSNRKGRMPSTEWLYGRIEGQQFIYTFTQLMVEELASMGYKAVAPCIHSRYVEINRISNWSERHIGYICGLGTFGLSESIITELGSAGRLTSIVIDLEPSHTPRTYSGIYDNCLWHMKKECGACMSICPPGAILEDGRKDKLLCKGHLDVVREKYPPRYGCGKCQTGMRCEDKNPMGVRMAD